MKLLITTPLFFSLARALWPIPTEYEHRDTVLWMPKDVEFFWYEAAARNVGSIAAEEEQVPGQFILAPDSHSHADTHKKTSHDLRLHKQFKLDSSPIYSYTDSDEPIN